MIFGAHVRALVHLSSNCCRANGGKSCSHGTRTVVVTVSRQWCLRSFMSVRVANQNLYLASWRGLRRYNLYGPITSADLDLKAKNWSRVGTCASVKFNFTFSPDTLPAYLVISSIPCKRNQPFCVGDEV